MLKFLSIFVGFKRFILILKFSFLFACTYYYAENSVDYFFSHSDIGLDQYLVPILYATRRTMNILDFHFAFGCHSTDFKSKIIIYAAYPLSRGHLNTMFIPNYTVF